MVRALPRHGRGQRFDSSVAHLGLDFLADNCYSVIQQEKGDYPPERTDVRYGRGSDGVTRPND